jgi:hypothetical protein
MTRRLQHSLRQKQTVCGDHQRVSLNSHDPGGGVRPQPVRLFERQPTRERELLHGTARRAHAAAGRPVRLRKD